MNKLLPSTYPVRRRGSCVPAAYLILRALGGGCAVHGYVGKFADEHTWVEIDGKIIDPTIRQFRWWRAGQHVIRNEIGRTAVGEFCGLFEAALAQPWTDEGHHYRKFVPSPVVSTAEVV